MILALVLVACGRPSAGAATHVRIAVGGQAQFLYLPTTLAAQLGYYRDEGLDVSIDDFSGGAQALEALLGGSADVVSGFYDHTIQLAADGKSLTAFVSMLRYPGLVLAVSPQASKPISRISDLKGARVGITAPGSSTQMIVTYLLNKVGLSASDVSFVGIGTAATAVAAIEHGSVDAGMLAEPTFTEIERRSGRLWLLADLRGAQGVREAFGTAAYPGAVLYSRSDWVAAHPGIAGKLARAIVRTLDWMQHHTPQQIADRMPPQFRGGDESLYVEALTHVMPMFSPDGLMPADGAQAVESLLAFSLPKVRQAHVDLSRTYTNRFVAAAAPAQPAASRP
ncbi:MAG: ABC transporter substrate-binding protein [Acidobacteriota bacterium]|nr:ABC transporter substrate-binding protein [Acidobacteriota bacterium]